jgi:hypothetical protein
VVFLSAALAFSAGAAAAQETALAPLLPLAETTARAGVIIRGHVVSASPEPHPRFPNLRTVVVEFRVERALKGATAGRFVFRHFVWDLRDSTGGYRKGQPLLLLLTPASEFGLSSPVALGQSVFQLKRTASGESLAVNAAGNARLFRGLAAALRSRSVEVGAAESAALEDSNPGPVPLARLESLIEALLQSQLKADEK